MGSVFRQRNKQTGWEGETWYIKYYKNGKPYIESSKSKKKGDAEKLLKLREGQIVEGKFHGSTGREDPLRGFEERPSVRLRSQRQEIKMAGADKPRSPRKALRGHESKRDHLDAHWRLHQSPQGGKSIKRNHQQGTVSTQKNVLSGRIGHPTKGSTYSAHTEAQRKQREDWLFRVRGVCEAEKRVAGLPQARSRDGLLHRHAQEAKSFR